MHWWDTERLEKVYKDEGGKQTEEEHWLKHSPKISRGIPRQEIRESYNIWGWKGPLKVIESNLPAASGDIFN